MIISNKLTIPIFFAVDDNYIPIIHVALRSLVNQASLKYNYNIHILYENINTENQKSLEVFNCGYIKIILNHMTETISKWSKKMHAKHYYSKAIYYRVFIPEMFPEYDKAIYLDSDITLNSDISELFNYDITDNLIGACVCGVVATNPIFTAYAVKFLGIKTSEYFNSGVLLLNCDELRKIHLDDKFFEILEKYKLEICPDQDYLNLICSGKTKILPIVWNREPLPSCKETIDGIKLVHYNLSMKPWRYDDVMYAELFWKHAKNTMFYEKILREKNKILKPEISRDKARMRSLLHMAKKLSKANKTLIFEIYDGRSPDRLAVLERIEKYEEQNKFDADVENNPLSKKIDLENFDFLNKKIINKLKSHLAIYMGRRFFSKMLKDKSVIFKEIKGIENITEGGAIITCNHIHIIDNYLIHIALEKALNRKIKLWKIIREGNFAFKGSMGFMLRNGNTLPIHQSDLRLMVKCIKATKTLISQGEKALIYPEQAMWWNYRKPRPLKDGAFVIATKARAPIIPCFLTMKDNGLIGNNGFPVQEITLHILPVINYDKNLSEKESIAMMKNKNKELWQQVFKDTYK